MENAVKPYLQRVCFNPKKTIESDSYPFNIPAIKALEEITFHSDVTFLVGENGSGKSTLLEALAILLGLNTQGGSTPLNISSTEHGAAPLYEYLLPVRGPYRPQDGYFLRAESFFNVATYRDERASLKSVDYKKIHHHSHGEAFITLITQKFTGHGIYLMDEPETALSPNRQLAALRAIHELVQKGSQFIIATHSPIILSYPQSRIYKFSKSGLFEVSYEDTEHFFITRDYMNNYPKRLKQLLE
ncbi:MULTISPECIES: AAA family ATPase [Brenneria]|uniref:AAA family ATPase n=1 Tax=Brenneria nigrifluens DSM 30175 = ATCC 13028 TaxID=1121120 RepID=A0A2U1UWS1_9GAMM|nr:MULTISPECIES: AAA family ATPase [Brenneria]EHD22535.1 AAA ATPase [Brenneria sp. EniD312]PWC26088.1 AAA family ATPase [Brenneria nigrifluens] [Brenneria nigrifluens DSM 30175 = ATCC 13028]QCR05528.1 ATP-binding cassette domain-containing protein [Brenneria nigrifluens DSM 30175 = ATCC 13028]